MLPGLVEKTISFSIIPKPAALQPQPGAFALQPGIVITTDAPNVWNAAYLQRLLAPTGFAIPIQAEAGLEAPSINLRTRSQWERLGREGYHLSVKPGGIDIEAPEAAGVFYGV